jgi:hypothetical protein
MSTTINGDTGIIFPDASTQSKAVSQATPFAVTASAIAGAELQLPEATANGVNYVAVKAPNTLAANTTFTLPAADGTNGQFLKTDGTGALAFASVPATTPGGTTGQVQINSAGAFGAVASGTVGQVLTSGGAGVAPSFATPTPAAWTLISTRIASNSASLEWTGLSGYSKYAIIFENLRPAGGDYRLYGVVGTGAGPTYLTSGYDYSGLNISTSGGVSGTWNTNSTFIPVTYFNTVLSGGFGATGQILLTAMTGSSQFVVQTNASYRPSGAPSGTISGETYSIFHTDTSAKTAFKLYFNGGNVLSGTASLYGISS